VDGTAPSPGNASSSIPRGPPPCTGTRKYCARPAHETAIGVRRYFGYSRKRPKNRNRLLGPTWWFSRWLDAALHCPNMPRQPGRHSKVEATRSGSRCAFSPAHDGNQVLWKRINRPSWPRRRSLMISR
jgi:hypothetical protein